jgi:probable F420-dependent oxidoreductase
MQFGIHLLGLGRRASVADFITAAKAAEELGYHSVWINDHVVIPSQFSSKYPYSPDGRPSFTADDSFYDPFVLLAAVASQTKTIKLGTSVVVIPHRPPILTAKAVATLDVISNGRFIFGLGVGWFAEELELLGVNPKERAKISRSYLDTMKSLWTETRLQLPNTQGQPVEVGFAPKPVQKPHPPLWFGGESHAALKRVVQQGDGWFPAFIAPEEFGKKADELKQLCAEYGRDFSSLTICVFSPNRAHATLDAVRTYREHGASIMLAPLGTPNVAEYIEKMKKFRAEVMEPARTL